MTYKKFAIDIAKRAGQIMKKNFIFGMNRQIKDDGSPVTETDLAINKLVVEEVKKYFPEHSVLGEEQSHAIENSEYTWVCDPVDGTIPFSRGMPTCAFSLALTKNGQPILGLAYDPFMNRMMVAEKGSGTYLNDKKVCVSSHAKLEAAYISHCVWSKMHYPMPGILDDLIFNKKVNHFGINSIVYNAMLLAAGEMEGITFGHTTAHDVAAIKIFVEEAGGKVTDILGGEQRYDRPVNGCVISNGLIHDELLAVVKSHLKI